MDSKEELKEIIDSFEYCVSNLNNVGCSYCKKEFKCPDEYYIETILKYLNFAWIYRENI